jgi:ribosome-associated protein
MENQIVILPDQLEEEFNYHFSRSSGKGGQHVNKVATRVEVVFDIPNSARLSEAEKIRLQNHLRGQLTRTGQLRLSCEETRSQHTNRDRATRKILDLLRRAIQPRKKGKGHQVRKASPRKRLAEKKAKGALKAFRGNIKHHQLDDVH